MVLDPTLPDPTPRLPVWLMVIDHGSVGWTADGWPVIKRGGAWVLIADGWRPLDDKKERLLTKVVAPDEKVLITTPRPAVGPMRPRGMASTMPATTMATTREVAATTEPAIATTEPVASTQPTSAPVARHRAVSTQPDGAILVDRDGRRYFDGQQSLHVIDKDGKTIDWPLPANAVGAADFAPVLLRTADGTLFLLNAPGRVVRIKRTPNGTAPFVVEAVFTHRIPSSDRIMRIWLDPAERIVIAYENNRMAILFPAGRIPSHIATMIPAKEMEQQP
jgi:hypothetical protein